MSHTTTLDEPSRLWQITAFCVIGLIGFFIYNGSLYVFTELAGWWHIASATVGFIANTMFYFPAHKYITYRNMETERIALQMKRFVIVRTELFLANVVVLYLLTDLLGLWYVEVQAGFLIFFGVISFVKFGRIFKKRQTA